MCGHRDTFAAKGQQTVKWFAGNAPVNSRNVETVTGEQFKKAFPSEARAFSHDFMRLTSVQDGRLYYIGAIGSSVRPITRRVVFVETDKPTKCGAMCRNAKGPMCDCSCKGDNHGAGVTMSRARFAAEDLDLRPTAEMAANAERGLALREEHGNGGTAVGVARARDIKNRANLSPDTVKRMHSFFSRHEGNQTGGEDDAGYIAWLLWGGDAGKAWAARKAAQINKDTNMKNARKGEFAVSKAAQPWWKPLKTGYWVDAYRGNTHIAYGPIVYLTASKGVVAVGSSWNAPNDEVTILPTDRIEVVRKASPAEAKAAGFRLYNARKAGFALDDIGSRERLKESIQRHQFYTDRIRRAQAEFRVAFREDFGINADPEVIRDLNAVVDRAIADSQRNPQKAAADLRAWADGITSMWMHHDHGKRTALAARQIAMQMANLASSGFARKATPNKDRFSMTYDEAEYQIATTLKNLYASQHSRPGAKAAFSVDSRIEVLRQKVQTYIAKGGSWQGLDKPEGLAKLVSDIINGSFRPTDTGMDNVESRLRKYHGMNFSRTGAKAAFGADTGSVNQTAKRWVATLRRVKPEAGFEQFHARLQEALSQVVRDTDEMIRNPELQDAYGGWTMRDLDKVVRQVVGGGSSTLRYAQSLLNANFSRPGAKSAFAHPSWHEGILGKDTAPALAAYSWIDRSNVPVQGRTQTLLADLAAGVHATSPNLSIEQAVLAAAKDMVRKGVATGDLREWAANGGKFSRPGASEAFALGRVSTAATPQADEALTALAAKVGREHTVSLFKRWAEGKAAMSRGDGKASFSGGNYYTVAAHIASDPAGERNFQDLAEAKAYAKVMLDAAKSRAKGKPVVVDVYPVVNYSPQAAVMTLKA